MKFLVFGHRFGAASSRGQCPTANRPSFSMPAFARTLPFFDYSSAVLLTDEIHSELTFYENLSQLVVRHINTLCQTIQESKC